METKTQKLNKKFKEGTSLDLIIQKILELEERLEVLEVKEWQQQVI